MDIYGGMNIPLSDREYNLFADLVYQKSGISLGDNKKELVKARLMKRLKYFNLQSYREYYEYVLNDASGEEIVQFLDAISTNVTSFFREKQHFDFMAHTVLPEIIERKRSCHDTKIRIWSAASSTGEEIYTILVVLLEFLKNPLAWDIKVLGTDISTRALVTAQKGVYDAVKLKTVSPLLLERYFEKDTLNGDKAYRVKDAVKQLALFRRFNLMENKFPLHETFDIIFCRNVMIYFDKETQGQLVQKLYEALKPGGYFFIGHSESLIGLQTPFKPVRSAVFVKK